MVNAIVGGVIMVVATTSLILALEVAEKAMNSAGRHCLTLDEKKILNHAQMSDKKDLDAFWSLNLSNADTHLDSSNVPKPSKSPAEKCI